jgi:hypothetical protein
MRGAHLITKRRLFLVSRGMTNVRRPITMMTIDHIIILSAPYLLILYQFSSDLNDFRKRMPYQQFIRILFFCKGIETAMIKTPTKMLVKASIALPLSISAIPYPPLSAYFSFSTPNAQCTVNGTALGTPDQQRGQSSFARKSIAYVPCRRIRKAICPRRKKWVAQ